VSKELLMEGISEESMLMKNTSGALVAAELKEHLPALQGNALRDEIRHNQEKARRIQPI
jgi:hypothetical protein